MIDATEKETIEGIVEDIRLATSAGSVTNTMEARVLAYCVSRLGGFIEDLATGLAQEIARATAAERTNDDAVAAIEWKVPSAASSENKLTDKAYVDGADALLGNRIAALAAGLDVALSVSPSVVYKGVQSSVTLTGTMVNGTPTEMKLMDGSTVLETGATSPITKVVAVTVAENSKAYKVVGTSMGLTLEKSASVLARYPIYYGFAASASALAVDANRYAATTSAAHTYEKTAGADGQHFYILVPSDISALTNFSMGGAPFVMSSSTQTVNGITYKVYTSGNVYNSGIKVTVAAS